MVRLTRLFVFLLILLPTQTLFANGGPENVVVVVNSRSSSSKLIANHYVRLRKIPARNVIYLDDIPNAVRIPYSEFRTSILLPVVAQIRERNINRQIDYIVYSSDIPTQVGIQEVVDKFMESASKAMGKQRAEAIRKVYRPVASINALTFFITRVLSDEPSFLALDANKYMRTRNLKLLKVPFVGATQKTFEQALSLGRKENFAAAIKILERLSTQHPKQTACHYWLARFYARAGNAENAIRCLNLARQSGWCYRAFTRADLAFSSLESTEQFQSTLDAIPDLEYRFLPTLGFTSHDCWGLNGMANANLQQGESYVLSTVLAVTRNQGLSEEEAIAQLSRAVAADGTKPQGTFYFTETSDVRTTTRKREFADAIKTLKELGQDAKIVKAILPKNRQDIAGLTIGTPRFSMTKTGNQLLPGAIAENLTSWGGALQPATTQTTLSEMLRHGAAGSSGTVIEPYSIINKFPHPNIHCHYVRGCNLAESFYQSVHGPFQLLIVGDALCQPWATIPQVKVTGLTANAVVSGTLELAAVFSKAPTDVEALEFFLDGVRVKSTGPSEIIPVDTTSLSDGYHELRIVAIGPAPIHTTGRRILPFQVNNQGRAVSLKATPTAVQESKSISVTAACELADRIEIRHNFRTLATIQGDSGTVKISARKIGRGQVRLMADAYFGNQVVRSIPMSVRVDGQLAKTTSTAPLLTPKRKK